MFGTVGLTDEIVLAAVRGSQAERAQVLEALEPQVLLMVVARLSPTASQFDAVEETAQEVLVALAAGLGRLRNKTIGGLKSYVSAIVVRKVADIISQPAGEKIGDGGMVSLDATVTALTRAAPLWQFLSLSGTSPGSAAERAEQAERLISDVGAVEGPIP